MVGEAIIQDPSGPAFRELALYYHEVGPERYRHLDRQGSMVAIETVLKPIIE